MFWFIQRLLIAAVFAASLGASALAAGFDWRRELLLIENQLSRPGAFNQSNCANAIEAWTSRLEAMPSAQFAPQSEREAREILAAGERWLERFFHVRILLKQHWNRFPNPGAACEAAMRRAFRFSRFAEDYLAEWLLQRSAFRTLPAAMFDGGAPHVLLNPKARKFDILPGDILIMRGPHFISGLIARSGDEQGDFSHLAIIGADNRGEKYAIEAVIEAGTTVKPLADYLRDKEEWRVVLLRSRDRALAGRAAREMYAHAQTAIDSGKPIPYNFKLDLSDETKLFCAQVARFAYSRASGGRIILPERPTRLTRFRGSPIARALNINGATTFAPSDIQFDRRFDIIAEFRNPKLLTQTRHANVAVSRLISWMQSGYQFKPDLVSEVMTVVLANLAARSSGADALAKDSLALLAKTGRAFAILSSQAAAIDAEATRRSGYPLTFRELEVRLESFRIDDCRAFQQDASGSVLHKLMQPPAAHCRLASR